MWGGGGGMHVRGGFVVCVCVWMCAYVHVCVTFKVCLNC